MVNALRCWNSTIAAIASTTLRTLVPVTHRNRDQSNRSEPTQRLLRHQTQPESSRSISLQQALALKIYWRAMAGNTSERITAKTSGSVPMLLPTQRRLARGRGLVRMANLESGISPVMRDLLQIRGMGSRRFSSITVLLVTGRRQLASVTSS